MRRLARARTMLLERMRRGDKPLGMFVSCLDPAVTDVLSAAGLDFVVLDNEHGRFGRIEVEHHVRAAEVGGAIPFVRVLENRAPLIQAMLDVGAQGVIVPHVDTAAEARDAVAASRYAPAGRRGMCPACHAGGYTMQGWAERSVTANDNVMVIPIIESRRSIANIDAILGVDGIDVVLFGPGDLSADMGVDLIRDKAALQDAFDAVVRAARAAGKFVMAPHGFGFDEADMMIVEMELVLLHRVASALVDEHRARMVAG